MGCLKRDVLERAGSFGVGQFRFHFRKLSLPNVEIGRQLFLQCWGLHIMAENASSYVGRDVRRFLSGHSSLCRDTI
jgi:hypothetical protein